MLKVLPFRLGHSDVLRAVRDPHQLLRMRVGQRVQQRGVNHAEDRCRRSNTQSHCHDCDSAESRRFAQHSKAEAHVLHQNIDKIAAQLFAAFFFDSLASAELDPRATLSFAAG